MIKTNKLPDSSNICENSVFIPLESIARFDERQYLYFAKKTIEHYQTHINQVPYEDASRLKLFKSEATAVIVGAGTVGLEAIVYATRILPLASTIIIVQNDVDNIDKLKHLLTATIAGGENFKWIISPAVDLGNIDQIRKFLKENKRALSKAQLFIHTADKAKRYFPDNTHYLAVISQVIRRCSISAIEELVESYANAELPYVRILFSSICSINRDKYRMPNIGPYQIGKIVGDELFRCSRVRDNSYSFIIYSGAMFTMGETLTRNEEYRILKNAKDTFNVGTEQDYTEKWSNAGTHVDSMDSSGLMFKIIWQALYKNKLLYNNLYSIYGSSVPKNLGYELNVLKVEKPAPYMFSPLDENS